MATKIRKGNPNVAAADDTRRATTQRAPKAATSSQLRQRAANASDAASKANPNTSSYKAHIKTASDSRLQARYQDKPSIAKPGSAAPSPSDRRFTVTRDNRPEAKGNYSGVDVNGKQVRKGKVKAAERMVAKSLGKAVAKRTVPYLGAAITGAEAGYAVGKVVRGAVESYKDKSAEKRLAKTFKSFSKGK